MGVGCALDFELCFSAHIISLILSIRPHSAIAPGHTLYNRTNKDTLDLVLALCQCGWGMCDPKPVKEAGSSQAWQALDLISPHMTDVPVLFLPTFLPLMCNTEMHQLGQVDKPLCIYSINIIMLL